MGKTPHFLLTLYLRVDTVSPMKQAARAETPATEKKVHRNFKLKPHLDLKLRAEGKRLKKKKVTQTDIVEIALAEYFAIKRSEFTYAK